MKRSITIGIGAYNESLNIKALIDSIMMQSVKNAEIKEVLVVSDASDDGTDEIVSKIKSTKFPLRLIRHSLRSGSHAVQNTLNRETTSDVLLVLDADIILSNKDYVEKIVAPILKGEASLTSGRIIPAKPKNFFEKVLARSHVFKNELYKKISKNYESVYLCFGPGRAMSKTLYSVLEYPLEYPVDAYSYFYNKNIGGKFKYVDDATAVFRCPDNFEDHFKQSGRFMNGQVGLSKKFDKADVLCEYKLPRATLFLNLLKEFIFHPVLITSYIFISQIVKVKHKFGSKKGKIFNSRWEISKSSKKI